MVKWRIIPQAGDLAERQQLLSLAGASFSVSVYVLFRKLFLLLCSLIAVGLSLVSNEAKRGWFLQPMVLYTALLIVLVLLCFDRVWLEWLSKRRRTKVVAEIFVLSRQLLYFSNSRMNLHAKLTRCIPFTYTIKDEMYTLINDWYEGPLKAIEQFKHRLQVDEAYSFAETLSAIHLNEDESYYELLRERIRDYKEKLELDRESKKESTSYVLFLLAGVPILYTFRVFIHPWAAEGQKIFQTLNF